VISIKCFCESPTCIMFTQAARADISSSQFSLLMPLYYAYRRGLPRDFRPYYPACERCSMGACLDANPPYQALLRNSALRRASYSLSV